MLRILKSTSAFLLIISALLLLLFKGIFDTYAYTDGYDFLWNSTGGDFINVFVQQGRIISGWINTVIYPHIHHVSDLSKVRLINLACLLLSSFLIYRILKQNGIKEFHALAIVIIFVCSPFASIVVHWEATSSAIWGYPFALFSGELIFNAYLNKDKVSKKRFDLILFIGITLALISLFIYQPAYTAFIFSAFVHFIMGRKPAVVWRFLLLHLFIYGIYFLLFKFQLNQLNFPADQRAGITMNPIKILVFIKGVFVKSLHHNIIFASIGVRIGIIAASLLLIGSFVYGKIKNESKNNKWSFILICAIYYVLAYFPNFISADNFVAYRTMGTVMLLTSTLLVVSIDFLSLDHKYRNVIIFIVAISLTVMAYYNNKTFTDIQSKEYRVVKAVIAEKLKQEYPRKIIVIMPEEDFLVKQKLVSGVVTDEFGKLSNTVNWTPVPFVLQGIYELTNDKLKVQTIEVSSYKRSEMPADSIVGQNDWILDIEQIYLLDLK